MPQAGHSIALLAVKMRVVSLSTLPEREEHRLQTKYINITSSTFCGGRVPRDHIVK